MLKKLIYVAFLLTLFNQATYADTASIQQKVRNAFSQIKNKNQVETVCQKEESLKDSINIEAIPANDEQNTDTIIATDQEQEDLEEVIENNVEEKSNIVEETSSKEECEEKEEIKTAAEASSKSRTAKINKNFSLEFLGWNTELNGHIAVADDKDDLTAALNRGNAKIDLKDDTSLDKKKVFGLKLAYNKGGRSSVELNYAKIDQDGHLAANIEKEFKGKKYGANGVANFKINNAMYDLLWKYRFSHNMEECGREKSYIAGLLGVKASKMEFTFDGQARDLNNNNLGEHHEDEDATIPVPYIGLEAGTYLSDNLYLKGYFRYLKLNNIKDYDAEHADYDISLSYKLSKKESDQDVYIDVGYRQVSYDVEGDGKDVELKYKGPYFGLEFMF